MRSNTPYELSEPARAEIDSLPGAALVEFGSPTCGWCRGAEPLVNAALAAHADVRHIRVEDGSGRPLGRSFGVKLWPTLVFLRDGREQQRLVRPQAQGPIDQALASIDS